MRNILLIILLTGFTVSVRAQFSDSTPYYAGFTSSGTYNQTNSNSAYLFNQAFKLSARKKNIRYNFYNKWLYGKQNNVLTNHDIASTLDINLYKTFPHFNYWGLFNFTSSYSLKIDKQLQAGIGVAYNIIHREQLTVNISDGFIYDYSEIILSDSSREKYGTIRNSLRLQMKGDMTDFLTASANAFYQPSIEYGKDYIIRSDINLGLKLRKWVSLTAALNYNKMRRTETENVFMTYGLIFERYF